MLKFSFGNSKIKALAKSLGYSRFQVASFDLPAGYTCPASNLCRSYANRETGYITDGKHTEFRCYAASTEAYSPSARRLRWHNFDSIDGLDIAEMTDLILQSIPASVKIIRVHSSGDFYKLDYYLAWHRVAQIRKDVLFFGYSKIPAVINDNNRPDNFHLVYSVGGLYDSDIPFNTPRCFVVSCEDEALAMDVPIACKDDPSDDFGYIMSDKSFALLIHGTQPKKRG